MTVLEVKALPSYYDQLNEAKKRIDALERALTTLADWADEYVKTGKPPADAAPCVARCVLAP